uniref:Pseudouridine synthase RsuA/RluA-like domain-containing protein n=1 Tax=Alexandrium monilatum TaxID=311494 RepID=A0A7S4QTX9_9DINO
MADEAVSKTAELDAQELCHLSCSLASLRIDDPELFRAVALAVRPRLPEFRPPGLSGVLWACARLPAEEPELVHSIALEAVRKLKEFGPRHLSGLAWAAATLGLDDAGLFSAIAEEAGEVVGQLKPQELSAIAWAFGTAKLCDLGQFGPALARATLRRAGEMSPQELCNLVWSFGRLALREDDLLATLGEVAAAKLRGFQPQDLAAFAHAFAKLEKQDDELLAAVAQEALSKVRGFEPQGLSNLAWAFATFRAHDRELLAAVGAEASRKVQHCKLQELANLAWAHAVLTSGDGRLLRAVSDAAVAEMRACRLRALSPSSLAEFATAALAVVWATSFSGSLGDDTLTLVRSLLLDVGRCLDSSASAPAGPPLLAAVAAAAEAPVRASRVLLELADRVAVGKPPGWQVDDRHEPGRTPLRLSEFLRPLLGVRRCPLFRDASHHSGLLHRLDIPSSGLLLVARTYEAYYDLQLQLNSGELQRDYLAVCHGWPSAARRAVEVPVFWRAWRPGPSRASARGRPALTRLRTQALARWSGGALGLLALRIGTGRRHQIRVHLAHVGHPLVRDGRYLAAKAAQADTEWCPRHFLHRHRLGFSDLARRRREALAPMPEDLLPALAELRPRDGASHAALQRLLTGRRLPATWDEMRASSVDGGP